MILQTRLHPTKSKLLNSHLVCSALLAFVVVLSSPNAKAEEFVKCKIASQVGSPKFAKFIDGTALIQIDDGSTRFSKSQNESSLEIWPISSKNISSYNVPRKNCTFGTEKLVTDSGALRWMKFNFNHCVPKAGNGPGFVKVDLQFWLSDGSGSYRELRVVPSGPTPSSLVHFKNCIHYSM